MKYLTFPSLALAKTRSGEIAASLGCGKKPEDITRFWFSVIEHPITLAGALNVPTSEETKLAPAEKTALQTESAIKTGGWMPDLPK